jgi:hypothetical protein
MPEGGRRASLVIRHYGGNISTHAADQHQRLAGASQSVNTLGGVDHQPAIDTLEGQARGGDLAGPPHDAEQPVAALAQARVQHLEHWRVVQALEVTGDQADRMGCGHRGYSRKARRPAVFVRYRSVLGGFPRCYGVSLVVIGLGCGMIYR